MKKITLQQFLQTIFTPVIDQGKYIEISRLENIRGVMKLYTITFPLATNKISSVVRTINTHGLFCDVYYSVCPREEHKKSESGHDLRSTNSNVSLGCVIWADIDAKKFDSSINKGKRFAKKAIEALDPQPNIIVDSGNGYHIYWLLDQAYPVEQVSYTCKRIATWLNADHCHDPARILRVPGTLNRKDPKKPKPSKFIRFDDTKRFSLDDFDKYPDVEMNDDPKHMRKIVLPNSVPNINIDRVKHRFRDPKLYAKIMAPDLVSYNQLILRPAPSRSERDYHVCCQLVKSGFNEAEVLGIFSKYPVGEKFREKGEHGLAYLAATLESAYRAVEEEKRFQPIIIHRNTPITAKIK